MKLLRNSKLIASIILGTILLLQTTTFGTTYSQSFIPDWVKNNADWWAQGLISDREFATGIGFLAKERIIQVENIDLDPQGQIVISDNLEIPAWIKNNARWWADEVISDNDFKFGIQYMLQEKIINFTPVYDPTKTLPSTATSDTMTYNISINPADTPKIISAVWDDPDDGDAELSKGDTLTITFNIATNQPGISGTLLKGPVDNLFNFENSLGANYTGKWIEPITFRITIDKNEDATHCIGDFVSANGTMSYVGDFAVPDGEVISAPLNMITNSTDHIFVADIAKSVWIFHPNGTYAGFLDPKIDAQGITTNSTDYIFPGNFATTIPIYNSNGVYSGVDSNNADYEFQFPATLTTNSTDHIFVGDIGNGDVVILHPNATFAGLLNTGALGAPRELITNSTDYLFATFSGTNQVGIFNPDETFAGFLGENIIVEPRGLATNSTQHIFVVDRDSDYSTVWIFHPNGEFAGELDNTGNTPHKTIESLAINSKDDVFLGDQNNAKDKVQIFTKGIRNSTSTSYSSTSGIDTTGNFGMPVLGSPQYDQFKDKIITNSTQKQLASNLC